MLSVMRKKYKQLILILSIFPVFISQFLNKSFFSPIKVYGGSENIAYKFPVTGSTLEADHLSRFFCWFFAVFLACLILYIFWNWMFFLVRTWKNKPETRIYIFFLFLANIFGLLFLAFLYPLPISLSPDTYYNYVYAKEWLPMYWHGFLTNVVYCAGFLIYPHPYIMTAIPFLFAINLLGYFLYVNLIRLGKYGWLIAMLMCVFLLLMPETIQIFSFVGRNYMYGIVQFAFLCIMLTDYLWEKELNVRKGIVLGGLLAILATWRTEGVIWLFFYPFLLFFTYFFEKKLPSAKKQLLTACILGLCCYCICNIPVKYGSEKYQGADYFIINLPGPLSVVLNHPDANLSYANVTKDMEKIDAIVPIEYIKKYGEYGSIYYNYENQRPARQCNAGEKGSEFVISSYRLLFHNLDIYLKFQINLFCESLYMPQPFALSYNEEPWELGTDGKETYEFIMDYYSVGEREIIETYNIVLGNKEFDEYMDYQVQYRYSVFLSKAYVLTGYVKLVVSMFVVILCIHALIKKRWLYVFFGGAVLGILLVIILTAPTARNNYYFYSFFSQYWFIFFYFLTSVKAHKERKREENIA